MRTVFFKLLIISVLLLGCRDEGPETTVAKAPSPPTVNDARTDLFFTWFGDDGPQTAETATDVPAEARSEVRVQDPGVPPDERNPDWVFLANLNAKDSKGNYKVTAMLRTEWEKRRRPARPEAPPASSNQLAPGAAKGVIMYATKTCPVCIKARRWLVDEKIPFVEKDVGSDQTAAAELASKGRAQGVSTSGVPVFDINGRLVPGFDKGAIKKLLAAPQEVPTMPAPPVPPPSATPAPSGQGGQVMVI